MGNFYLEEGNSRYVIHMGNAMGNGSNNHLLSPEPNFQANKVYRIHTLLTC